MAAATAVGVVSTAQNTGMTLLRVNFTKANVNDTVAVPAGYGSTVVWCDMCKISTLVKDPATAVTGLTVTCSVGTGEMTGLFLVV